MKSMKKISISARLILVMSLIAILTAGLSAYLIIRFIESGKQVKVLAEEGTQGIVWGEKANFYLHNLIINFYRANSGDMKWVRAMEENIPKIRSALNEYAKTAQDPENKRLLAETYEALDIYANDIVILGKSFRKGIYGPAIIQVLNDLETKPHANRLISDINSLVEYSKAMAEKNRASFFADMSANTQASIILACFVILILIWAGYMGVIWTRDEIAEYNAKEQLLKKLQTDLLNSLEAAGGVSRQFSFDTGEFTYVGAVDKVLGRRAEEITTFADYVEQMHPDDRKTLFGEHSWEKIGSWESIVALYKDDFSELKGTRILKKDSELIKKLGHKTDLSGTTKQLEYRLMPEDAVDGDEWRWKRSLSKLLVDESGHGYVGESGIIFDITEEHEIKNELIRAKYDAEEASRAKSDFLARMSHEIRTPMNAIIGMTHLILRTQLNETQRDYQTKIQASAQALMGIINDILDFSKIEAGRMDLEKIPFRLDEVLNTLADVTLIKAQEKQLEVIFSVSDDTPQWLVGDSLRLSQVLTNLTNNAVKFTPSGEILVNVGVMEQDGHQAQLHFSVTDSGIGLTTEQIQNLFQPFSQADGSITRKFGGTGLGLAICKSLVEAMAGRIWVESQPNKGSSFHFTVRLALAPNQPEKLYLPQDLRQLRTLIIDDNATARNSFAEMLGAIFMVPPDTASSPDKALEKIEYQKGSVGIPYDLIFVDWKMPDKDGVETTRLIKEKLLDKNNSTSVVLMVNSYEMEKIRSSAKLAGVDAFLTKPTCPSNIFDTVANLYDKKSGAGKVTPIEVSRDKLERVRGTRILLVEDNPFNQQVAREFLEQAGMVVEIAENGFAALQAIDSKKVYDLVFMDIQMPDLDGLEVARRMREKKDSSRLPIVAMTAHAMTGDREKSLAAGMNDHITKPIDPEELMSILVKWGKTVRIEEKSPKISILRPERAEAKDIDLTPYRFSEIEAGDGLRRCMGNARSYLKFLKMFYREYYNFGQRCEENMNSSEFENVRHLAHAIKGPAGSIGARKLHSAAHDLEQALWNSDKPNYDQLFRSFQNALQAVIRDLAPIMKQADKNKETPPPEFSYLDGDLAKGKELLAELHTRLKKNDAGTVDILPEFRRALAGEDLAEELSFLQVQIENFDFDEAMETLKRIESWLESEEGPENDAGKASNSNC